MRLNNLSASAFADEIGVQRSSISHILSGRNKPSLEFIQKVLKRYPKVDAGWLINGTTSVESDKYKPETTHSKEETPTPQEIKVSTAEPSPNVPSSKEGKKINRILVFYDDQSFEEFSPS